MRPRLRALAVALVIAFVGLASLGYRLARVQASAMEEASRALESERFERAIAAYRRAARAHHPLSSRTDEALGALLDLGARLEPTDADLARLAYASAWGGMNAVTPGGTSSHPLAREAERRLSALGGATGRAERVAARPLGKLATAVGLALAVAAGFQLARGGGGGGDRLRRTVLSLALFAAGLALFTAGALHA